jgi:UDP-N-acetyl-D-mannosaminuronate dehydrogenase
LLLGLAYKADVDDLRESPALVIARTLLKESGIELLVCEPNVSKQFLPADFISKAVSLADGLSQADIIVGLVAHTPFKAIEKQLIAHKKFIDFCGLLHVAHKQSVTKEQFFSAVRSDEDFTKQSMQDVLSFGRQRVEKEGTP